MKKKLFVSGICIAMLAALSACGDSSMSYEDYDLTEYLEVGEYKGLEVAPYEIKVSDKEVQDEIDSMLEASATLEKLDKDAAIQDGDTANIDYVGKVDGKKFDGGSAEGYDLAIGSGTFIDGFEDGLIGKKTGDKVDLNLTFPEDYSSEDLQGKDVVFTVTVNSVSRSKVPEYTLDYIKETTSYKSLEEYEEAIREQLTQTKENEALQEQKTTLWSAALENTEVLQYPEREVEHYIEFNSDQIDEMAEMYGMTREEMLEAYEFTDEEEFNKVNEESSQLRVKQEMLVEYITQKEGLEYTEEEATALIDQYTASGYDEETVQQQTGRSMEEYVRIELLYNKAMDFLLENAVITGEPVVH